MDEISINPRSAEPFAEIIGDERLARFVGDLEAARERLDGATVWHINSTGAGGGVAEMLQSVLSYPAGAGIDVRWLVIEGSEPFFELTKRIHHLLHGSSGDDGPLGEPERKLYEQVLGAEEQGLAERVRPGDVVVLHDPQVVGLARRLAKLGAVVIWSCHIGADEANDETRRAWEFLLPYVAETAAQTFSRRQYEWENLEGPKVAVIPPCIDAFATKNEPLDNDRVAAILAASAIIPRANGQCSPEFHRQDGSAGTVTRRAETREEAPIGEEAPIVCQISRWDPLKDHGGLMKAFVEHVDPDLGAQLVLAGPAMGSVDDDPEASATFARLVEDREQLEADARERVHICSLPMDDVDENAAIVNALQRRSDVIVQKSLAEGFGLTVAEAMWKGRPTLGSRVGGIQDQIVAGESGVLVDATDSDDLGAAVTSLLSDADAAARLGEAGRRRVIENYLAPSYLTNQFALIERLVGHQR
jgi:trehalose synthase